MENSSKKFQTSNSNSVIPSPYINGTPELNGRISLVDCGLVQTIWQSMLTDDMEYDRKTFVSQFQSSVCCANYHAFTQCDSTLYNGSRQISHDTVDLHQLNSQQLQYFVMRCRVKGVDEQLQRRFITTQLLGGWAIYSSDYESSQSAAASKRPRPCLCSVHISKCSINWNYGRSIRVSWDE